jgi:acylphosphatase
MAKEGMMRAHVVVSGYVQGVFFRSDARDMARTLRLAGWVMNRYDGCVEAVFEGPKREVEEMIEWCHRGPVSAHVDNVDVKREEYTGEFDTFEIRF